jgi:hypothetical protein
VEPTILGLPVHPGNLAAHLNENLTADQAENLEEGSL